MGKVLLLLPLLVLIGCSPKEDQCQEDTQKEPSNLKVARDDFSGRLNLDWQIVNPDKSHYSVTRNLGSLTITTQKGGFLKKYKSHKNIFLVDNPVPDGKDFELTTCLVAFNPSEPFQQAGIVCFNDDDNYLKWVSEYGDTPEHFRFTTFWETAGRQGPLTYFKRKPENKQLWLRLSKQGNSYTTSYSTDGKTYQSRCVELWGNGIVKQIGFIAINGPFGSDSGVDAIFDFFEIRQVHHEPKVEQTVKYVIPKVHLDIPEDMKSCATNLKKINEAIDKYQDEHKDLPNWLSDLVEEHLAIENLLCKNSTNNNHDPKLPCNYYYDFNPNEVPSSFGLEEGMSYRQWKKKQVEILGNIVPVVRCKHGPIWLNLSVDGQIYFSPDIWETLFLVNYTHGDEFNIAD